MVIDRVDAPQQFVRLGGQTLRGVIPAGER